MSYSNVPGEGFLIHRGVQPDEEVWLTRDGVARGEDDVVKRALEWITTVAYAHDVWVSRTSRDTIAVLARVENPQAHTLNVVASLKSGSGAIIDSLFLADDGIHGDSSAADGLWGSVYVPTKDDTIYVHVRTDDQTDGTSRSLPNAVTYLFTHKAILLVDNQRVNFGQVEGRTPMLDTTFIVRNIGESEDSIDISIDYVLVSPESAVAVTPTLFALAPGDSQEVTFTLYPPLLAPSYYSAIVWVQSRFGYGQTRYSKVMMFQKLATDVVEAGKIPNEFELHQNYPNPFNPSTTIRYALPERSHVTLTVFNALGQQVATLVQGEMEAGYHEAVFDAVGLASGVYLYRLTAGAFVETRKLVLVL